MTLATDMLEPDGVPASEPDHCELCLRKLEQGDAYRTLTLGWTEAPSTVGAPPDADLLADDSHELYFCTGCAPAVSTLVDTFVAALWHQRAEQPPQ